MQLFALVALTMTAFAANSLLNRIGIAWYAMGAMDFAAIRVVAGAAMLWLLIALRSGPRPPVLTRARGFGALALAVYMVGFSAAYLTLDAGLGALILFGVLQVVVFGWAVVTRQNIPPPRWMGAGVALVGLAVLLWPAGGAPVPLAGMLAMIAAAVGWAVYTLLGRAEADALGATAGNFLLCVPLTGLAMWLAGPGDLSFGGVLTAVLAGAVTSGLGYAMWYRALPQLATTSAGIAQLSVPVIAVLGGVAFLSEDLTWRLLLAGALVLGGIAFSMVAPQRQLRKR